MLRNFVTLSEGDFVLQNGANSAVGMLRIWLHDTHCVNDCTKDKLLYRLRRFSGSKQSILSEIGAPLIQTPSVTEPRRRLEQGRFRFPQAISYWSWGRLCTDI